MAGPAGNGDYGMPRVSRWFAMWFDIVRVVVLFGLGVALIVYAAVSPARDVPFVTAGLVLCGLVPADLWISARRRAGGG